MQIAGFGVALGLSLLIESPVIMLLATAIALVQGASRFRSVAFCVDANGEPHAADRADRLHAVV